MMRWSRSRSPVSRRRRTSAWLAMTPVARPTRRKMTVLARTPGVTRPGASIGASTTAFWSTAPLAVATRAAPRPQVSAAQRICRKARAPT